MAGKKKATMTLKDFHGGSIPSDLSLPSAPGQSVRPMDRPVFEHPGRGGAHMGRFDHQLRPGSAGSVRNKFNDKTPFLGLNAHIGRNFDEDERKPLDGGPWPGRVVSDDSIRPFPTRGEVTKSDYLASLRQPPSQQFSSASPNSYAGKASEAAHGGTSLKFGGNLGSASPGPYPNAFAMWKEAVVVAELPSATWSGPNAATKLAHASAIDEVSSGRWQSTKQSIHHPANVKPIRHSETEKSYCSADVASDTEYQDAMLASQVERSLAVDDGIRGGGKEIPSYEKARSPLYPDQNENISHSGNTFGLVTPFLAPPEQPERPKLKLLPRSKPLDNLEPPIDHNQGYHRPQNYEHVHKVTESYETVNYLKSGLTLADSGNQLVERPKLNLKLRSQAFEQVEGTTEKGRNTVFGGARPRELVLKDRGIDDVVVNNHDMVQPHVRVKQDLPRNEIISHRGTASRYSGKLEGAPLDNRIRKNNDKRDNHVDAERTDIQKRNWGSENQRNRREIGIKHQSHHQPQHERPTSPDTWHKSAEERRPTSLDGTGLRYGKAASAVELAQAFSKSVSDPKAVDRFPNQRGSPRLAQIPFSRLTDPASRPQINGY